MEPLMALLPTDTLPDSVIFDNAERIFPFPTSSINSTTMLHSSSDHQLPMYIPSLQQLHSIPEEASDDELSHSSSRATTIIHADYCDSTRLSTPILDSTLTHDTEGIDQELVKDFSSLDCSRSFFRDLAEGLRAIDSDTDSGSNQSSASIADDSKKLEQKNMEGIEPNNFPIDCGPTAANTAEESSSLKSASISFDRSRDSILDASLCSNPIDEAAIMESSLKARSSNFSDFDDQANNRDDVRIASDIAKISTVTDSVMRPNLASACATVPTTNAEDSVITKTLEFSEPISSSLSAASSMSPPSTLPPAPPLLPPPPLHHSHRAYLQEIRSVGATENPLKGDKAVLEQLPQQQQYCDLVAGTTTNVSKNRYNSDVNSNSITLPFTHFCQQQSLYTPLEQVSSSNSRSSNNLITTNPIIERKVETNEYIQAKAPSENAKWNRTSPKLSTPPSLPSLFLTSVSSSFHPQPSSSDGLMSQPVPKTLPVSRSGDFSKVPNAVTSPTTNLLSSSIKNNMLQPTYDAGDEFETFTEHSYFEQLRNQNVASSSSSSAQQTAFANATNIDTSKTSLPSPPLSQLAQFPMSSRSSAYQYTNDKEVNCGRRSKYKEKDEEEEGEGEEEKEE
uniref:Uncharacterized protein n=1 Tax=Syphacia muris TaxID=451379 RepID=A0A0N5AIY5_9BILA